MGNLFAQGNNDIVSDLEDFSNLYKYCLDKCDLEDLKNNLMGERIRKCITLREIVR